MFLTLLLAGAVVAEDAETDVRLGPVVVPNERTATIPRLPAAASAFAGVPFGALEARQPYDPADRAAYAFDFSSLLEPDEKIADILSIRLGAAAPALGVTIDTDVAYSPMIDNQGGQKAQLVLVVGEAQQESASYVGAGVRMPVTMKIKTDATPPNTFERTIVVAMRQL